MNELRRRSRAQKQSTQREGEVDNCRTVSAVVRRLAEKSAGATPLTRAEALRLAAASTDELLRCADILRRRFFGDTVHLCSIINAKSGACSENCRFCAQSAHNPTKVATYPLVASAKMRAAYEAAAANSVSCFSVVTSGKRVSGPDVEAIASAAQSMRVSGARVSASLGELDDAALRRLRDSGVTRFHHNLETSRRFFPHVCTTHSYDDRVATIRRAQKAGFQICSGGLFGLGETMVDRVDLARALRALKVDSVPLNFLNPVPGTPLADAPSLSPREILHTIALFRCILPRTNISVCGGREVNLRDMQSWIFYAGASGMMVGGYLTTAGRTVEQDLRMVRDAGMRPLRETL